MLRTGRNKYVKMNATHVQTADQAILKKYKDLHVPGHVNKEIVRHLPGKMHQFSVPQQGCLNLGFVGHVLFDIEERQCKPDPHTSKHQYYEPN